jgi:hypothetical protein
MKTHHGKAPLLARLREVSKPTDPVPPEFKTAPQWAREWGVHALTAGRLLRDGVAAGVMKRKSLRVRLPDGRTYPTPHYAER